MRVFFVLLIYNIYIFILPFFSADVRDKLCINNDQSWSYDALSNTGLHTNI